MHFVAALDSEPRMRAVLALFEGVATGAADGYARMADKPAATLLHLGCGLGNSLANLHNARKGKVPMLNIVGDHATTHVPSTPSSCSPTSRPWRATSRRASCAPRAARVIWPRHRRSRGHAAKGPARPGGYADPAGSTCPWGDGALPLPPPPLPAPRAADDATVPPLSPTVRSGGGHPAAGWPRCAAFLLAAARIARPVRGVTLLAEVFPDAHGARRGPAGRGSIAYLAEMAGVQLAGLEHLILVDAKAPVSFFAYPGKRATWCPTPAPSTPGQPGAGCTAGRLDKLARSARRRRAGVCKGAQRPASRPPGKLTAPRGKVCKAVGHLLPENAIPHRQAITSRA